MGNCFATNVQVTFRLVKSVISSNSHRRALSFILTAGTPVLRDQRDPLETILASLLDMDLGANPLRDLYTGNRNLKSILKFTRGQWRDFKTCVMCAFILLGVSARAAELICSLAGRSGKEQTGEHCSSPDMHQSLSICYREKRLDCVS